jgi:hypothetical protein
MKSKKKRARRTAIPFMVNKLPSGPARRPKLPEDNALVDNSASGYGSQDILKNPTFASAPSQVSRSEQESKPNPKQKWNVEKIVQRAVHSTGSLPHGQENAYEIKWEGYDETTWEPIGCIRKDVPAIVRRFERELQVLRQKAAAATFPDIPGDFSISVSSSFSFFAETLVI